MNDTQRWEAVLARDKQFDGQFVLAVRTTGIYCRPSCPARRPHRENVTFYATSDDAEAAGFRACKRCQPRQAVPDSPQLAWVHEACHLLESDETLNLDQLAGRLGLSPYHVQRVFKRVMGISPRQYAAARRLERVKVGLKQEDNVTMAIYEAGYGSASGLYERTDDHLGMTPKVYRRGGAGMDIGYTIVASPLGRLLVAATERGVCFVSLGDNDATLATVLANEYEAASIHRADADIAPWVEIILNYLRGEQPDIKLPLDVQATAFQWQVWEALRAIPVGATRSYGDIARSINNPKAARAVGHACATNPVALVIPCHRAVRENGALGGYRWGLDIKEALLSQEQMMAAQGE